MRKNLSAILFTAFCLLVCIALSLGFLAFGPSEAGANEVLSAAPSLRNRDGTWNTAFLSDAAGYFSDHFFLRQELITAHNAITASLFGVSAEDSVILGSGGWLYYADSLDDYTGASPLSEAQLRTMANNLSLMREYCENQGARFLFAVAPNKNSLYGENMPSFGAVSPLHDARRLFAYLDGSGVAYVDLFEIFSRQEDTLYFAHDSHWNARGAALAADSINASFGRESAYFPDAFSESQPHSGDLFEMLYPSATDDETDPVYGGSLSFSHESENVRPDSITIDTFGDGSGSLLSFRDSFGNNLYPYLADSFASARFSRATAYDLTQISALSADYVLIELVERNLDYLLRYIPVMPAPAREAGAGAPVCGSIALQADRASRSPEGCLLIKGTLPASADAGTRVYILAGGSAYEAFVLTGGGFAAYIPEDCVPEAVSLSSGGAAAEFTAEMN